MQRMVQPVIYLIKKAEYKALFIGDVKFLGKIHALSEGSEY